MGHVEDSSYAPTTDLHAGGANSQATVGCLLAAEQTSSFNSSPDGRALNPLKLQAEIITFSQGAQTLLPICKGWFLVTNRNQSAKSPWLHLDQTLWMWICHLSLITACRWTLHTILCYQDLPGTRSYHSMCVCLPVLGILSALMALPSASPPSFGQKYSTAGQNTEAGNSSRGPSPDSSPALRVSSVNTGGICRQSVQAPCLHFVYQDIVKDRTEIQKTLCPSTEKIDVFFSFKEKSGVRLV